MFMPTERILGYLFHQMIMDGYQDMGIGIGEMQSQKFDYGKKLAATVEELWPKSNITKINQAADNST